MNNTTCPPVSFTFKGRFLPPVYILVFIIGLVAHGWGLKSLLHNWQKLKIINMFVLNLGFADILYLLTFPFLVVYYLEDEWIFGSTFCKITRFCFYLSLYGSIGFLTCISVYRYLAIVHPVKVMGTKALTHSRAVSLVVWLLVIAQCLPDVFYTKTNGRSRERCYDTTHDNFVEDYLKYSLGRTITGFWIPLLIMLGCYGHMAVVLWAMKKADKALKQRTSRLLLVLILLFSVSYIPHHVFTVLNLWVRVLSKQRMCRKWFDAVYIVRQISCGLTCLSCVLNPLVYLHVCEDIPAQLRQKLQQLRQILCSLFLSNPSRERGAQTVNEV